MSFAFCPAHRLLLKGEFRENIMTKIKDIQVSFEWHNFDLGLSGSDLDVSMTYYEDICRQMSAWADIGKLSIDLWRDYDYYARFMFESQHDDKEYRDRLEALGCVCVNGLWRSVSRPSEEVVQTNVFMFCVYKTMCEEMDRIRNDSSDVAVGGKGVETPRKDANEETASGVRIGSVDIDVKMNVDKVDERRASKDSSKINIVDQNMVEKGNEDVGDLKKNKSRVARDDVGGRDLGHGEKMNLESIKGKDERGRLGINKDTVEGKWKCGSCSLFNKYGLTNCVVCGAEYKDGRWTCTSCTMENSCAVDVCDACFIGNGAFKGDKSKSAQDRPNNVSRTCGNCRILGDGRREMCRDCGPLKKEDDVQMRNDKWKCGKCESFYSYDVDKCGKCGTTLLGSGLWTCTSCTFCNKWADKKCTVCGALNNRATDVRNNVTTNVRANVADSTRTAGNISQWKCSFLHCGDMNKLDVLYCNKCKLYREHSRARGDLVKGWRRGREEEVWICAKCHQWCDKLDKFCDKCRETRYKKRFCHACQKYNDGTTTACDFCGNILWDQK